MNDSKNNNLSGFWSGTYNYAQVPVATPFNLFMEDNGGDLSGTTLEPNTFARSTLAELSATITGARAGSDVTFRKVYDAGQGAHANTVFYEGKVNADLTVIEGFWTFRQPHMPTGGFRLSRASGAAEEAEEKVAADVGA